MSLFTLYWFMCLSVCVSVCLLPKQHYIWYICLCRIIIKYSGKHSTTKLYTNSFKTFDLKNIIEIFAAFESFAPPKPGFGFILSKNHMIIWFSENCIINTFSCDIPEPFIALMPEWSELGRRQVDRTSLILHITYYILLHITYY